MEQYIGPQSIGVVAGLLLIIATGAKGTWVFRYQIDREIAAKDAIIAELREQLVEQRAGSTERLTEMRIDRDEWKEIALQTIHLGKAAMGIEEKP